MEIRDNIIHLKEEDAKKGIRFPVEKIVGYAIVPKEKFNRLLEKAGMTFEEFCEVG
jgi:hypothetical protein